MSEMLCPCIRPCDNPTQDSSVMDCGQIVRFDKGDVLWRAGEPATWVGVVCVGILKFTRTTNTGAEIVFDLVERGRTFGEEATSLAPERAWDCLAISSGRAVRLHSQHVRAHLQSDEGTPLSEHLLSTMVERSQNAAIRLDEMVSGDVEARMARVMVRMAARFGIRDARGTFIPIRLSRSELAGFVACREETVIRLMSKWEKKGLILTQREGFVLSELDALQDLACPHRHDQPGLVSDSGVSTA